MAITKVTGSVMPVLTFTPEMFGAVGDGVADDTLPLQNAFNAAASNATQARRVNLVISARYATNETLNGGSFVDYTGGGTILTNSTSTTLELVHFDNCSHFTMVGINLTRTAFPEPKVLWSKQAQGITFVNCTDFTITGCDISYQTDALSVQSGARFTISNCRTHELGEEGIAIRRSNTFVCDGNFVYHHHGDGILMKTANTPCYAGQVTNNHVFDGYKDPAAAAGQRGGGITLNDEVIGEVSGEVFRGMVVTDNIVRNTSYGIAFANIDDLKMQGNHIQDIERFGYLIDTTLFNNPSLVPYTGINISGNTARNVVQAGLSVISANGINISRVVVANNTLSNTGTHATVEYPSIVVTGGTVTGNYVYSSKVAFQGDNVSAVGNFFDTSTRTSSGAGSAWIKLSGSFVFSNNKIKDDNMGHIRLSAIGKCVFSDNVIELTSAYAALSFITDIGDGSVFSGNVYSCPNYPSISQFNVGIGTIRRASFTEAEFGRSVRMYDATVATGVTSKVGDVYKHQAAGPGQAHTKIVEAVDGSGNPTMGAMGFHYRKVSTTADISVVNGTTQQVKVTGLTGVNSAYAVAACGISVPAQGLMVSAFVTNAQEVTFLIHNLSGNDRTIPGVTFNAYVHEVV